MDRRSRSHVLSALVALLVLALVVTAGCSGVSELRDVLGEASSRGQAVSGQLSAPSGALPPQDYGTDKTVAEEGGDQATPPKADALVIRSKTMRIEVKDVKGAVEAIRAAASKHGGSIAALQIATDEEQPIYRPEVAGSALPSESLRGWVTVRVPVDAFEAFVAEAVKIGTVKAQSESSEDVTQQHVDLSARLENLRAEEKRLREFFAATKNVQEMLSVERELARVRGEIESLDAQVKYLERQAALATVTIELTEPKPVIRPAGETWGFLDAITTGFRGAAATIKIAIVVTLTLLPAIAIAVAAYYLARALVRRRRRRSVEPRDALSADTHAS
ncbi:MAG: DUF4349 domain-containing protein [Coriobacteriia bacterium]|nr:DUF4349 domain-containing protein [Coriobacteriia bacterium]